MIKKIIFILVLISVFKTYAQLPHAFTNEMKAEIDALSRIYVAPQRVVWTSSDSLVKNPEVLLNKGNSQAYFGKQPLCKIINKDGKQSGLILDFGKEIHGGVQLTTSQSNSVTRKIRIRFGESVTEANSDQPINGSGYGGGKATNHHAMRDFELTLPGYGSITVGNTGFRFVRIDLVEEDVDLVLKEIRGVAVLRNIPYLGSFKSNDEELNNIWSTGAYTVHLCMQDYLWDGIKRDRMVWAGDMHPEMMTINAVFGYNEVVPKTLDFLRDTTPLPKFMNGISSYSMWWVLMQHDWYQAQGKLDYLQKQKEYLVPLLKLFTQYVDKDGNEQLYKIGMRFIDWPTYRNSKSVHAGLQALMTMTFEKGSVLCEILNEKELAKVYQDLASKMRKQLPETIDTKQAASLLALSGMMEAKKADTEIVGVGGAKDFSAFFGYYMLQTQAMAGNHTQAIHNIKDYWGGMLKLGATTFWEEFDLEEAKNAAPIDGFVPEGKLDYHKDTGAECYIGLRRSLCHGWASGPTAWLSEHVLGIKSAAPGFSKVIIEPHLGDLEWVEGTFPTPYGLIKVRHEKKSNGEIKSTIQVPKGVKVVKK